jgi:hypothetical protein
MDNNETVDTNTFSFKSSIISKYLMRSEINDNDCIVLLDAFDVIVFPPLKNVGKVFFNLFRTRNLSKYLLMAVSNKYLNLWNDMSGFSEVRFSYFILRRKCRNSRSICTLYACLRCSLPSCRFDEFVYDSWLDL